MQHTYETEVGAPADVVWNVLVEADDWPRWTKSMTSVELLDGPLALGRRARLVQPRLSPGVWTVTAFEPGREFTWESRAAGVVTVGSHVVHPLDGGRSRLVLGLEQRGALAGLIALVFGARVREYVQLEAAGLKAAAEDRVRRHPAV